MDSILRKKLMIVWLGIKRPLRHHWINQSINWSLFIYWNNDILFFWQHFRSSLTQIWKYLCVIITANGHGSNQKPNKQESRLEKNMNKWKKKKKNKSSPPWIVYSYKSFAIICGLFFIVFVFIRFFVFGLKCGALYVIYLSAFAHKSYSNGPRIC